MVSTPSTEGRIPLGIALQLWVWAAMVRPLKHVVSMRTLVGLVRYRRERHRDLVRTATIVQYLSARGRFPGRPPGNCYDRSFAAYRLLGAAGARPELRVGVRRPGGRTLDGHVWVVLDGHAVAETPAFIEQFTTILRVDAAGRFEPLGSTAEASAERRWTDLHGEPTHR